MMENFGPDLTWAAITIWLLQQIKAFKAVPWVTAETAKINRIISIAMALLAGLGIHFVTVFDPSVHQLRITISGLNPVEIMSGLAESLQTFVLQQVMWHGMIKPNKDASQ